MSDATKYSYETRLNVLYILPCQLDRALVAAGAADCVLQHFHWSGRRTHLHLHPAQILGRIVGRAPLPCLFVDDEFPRVRIFHVDIKRVIALRHCQVTDH